MSKEQCPFRRKEKKAPRGGRVEKNERAEE